MGFLYQVWARSFDIEKIINAEEILLRAVERFPRNQLPYWALTGIYIDQGKQQDALGLAAQALNLDPNVRMSILRYLLTLKLTNQVDLAYEQLEEYSKKDSSLVDIITPYLEADLRNEKEEMGLLFRFYYDAAF